MEYKIKPIFPPRFWEPMPYTIDGKDFSQFSGETEELINTLERNEILTAFSDEQALMAKYAGYEGKEKIFRDFIRMWFISGDIGKIKKMVFSINEKGAK